MLHIVWYKNRVQNGEPKKQWIVSLLSPVSGYVIPSIFLDRHLVIQQILAFVLDAVLDSGDMGMNKTEKNPCTHDFFIPGRLDNVHSKMLYGDNFWGKIQ